MLGEDTCDDCLGGGHEFCHGLVTVLDEESREVSVECACPVCRL